MLGRAAGMWAMAVVGAVAGCQCEDNLKSVAPLMEVVPDPVAFGKVAVGSAAEVLVNVHNRGTAPLRIESIEVIEGAGHLSLQRVLTTDCQGNNRTGETMSVAAGGCARFAVRTVPLERKPFGGVIRILSDDGDTPELDVPVTGEGVVAGIRACVLTVEGEVDDEACTNFEAVPPLIPVVNFGELPLNEQAIRTVRVFNLGEGKLVISNARVHSDVPDLFVVGDAFSGEVEVGAFIDVDVAFAPQGSGNITGTLLLPSNDPDQGSLELPIVAEGLGAGLCFTPEVGLDFGAVAVGDTLTKTLQIDNCGFVNYKITQLTFAEDDPTSLEYSLRWVTIDGQEAPEPVTPLQFPPGTQLFAEVTYAPSRVHGASDVGDKAGFAIRTEFQNGRIPVIGKGASPGCGGGLPTANIVIRDGSTDITSNPNSEPLRTLTFDGATSTSAVGGTLSYVWRLVRQPQGGSVSLTGNTASRRSLFLQLAGEYEVELVVQDQYGCQSPAATAVVRAIPNASLHVQLIWPEFHGDVDLHLMRTGGAPFSANDCYWSNCMPSRTYGPYSINWGPTAANPTLDIDATWGKGPENINIDTPIDGTYTVGVHYYCSRSNNGAGATRGAATPRVRVFVNGTAMLDETKSLTQRDLWTAGVITVSNNGTSITVTPSTAAPSKVTQGCTTDGN